jgi:ABC-2 type transport system ATP-binding protein
MRVEGLTRRYGRKTALDEVSFTVGAGSVFGLLGPNGAGKTTLVRIALGLVRATSGSVALFGLPLPGGAIAARTRIGAMVEIPRFYPHLSGRDNLRVLGTLSGADEKALIDAVLDAVELSEPAGDPVRGWSQGMRQRLGIAQALLGEPDLVILDEPTNGLDPHGVREVLALLRRINRDRGTTFLILSHQLDELETIADHVAVLRRGRLLAAGPVGEVVAGAVTHHRLRGGSPGDAQRALRDRLEGEAAGALRIRAGRDEIPGLIAELLAAGIAIHEVTPVRRSLFEWFLAVTGEEEADHGR